MGAGAVRRLLSRVRRRHLFAFLGVIVAGAILWPPSRGSQADRPKRSEEPDAVGAYSIRNEGGGEVDFAVQTDEGRFGLKVGSRDFQDMPYGLPFYPGAKLIDSANMKGGSPQTNGRYVHFETRDPPDRVADFYRRLTIASKWLIVTDETLDDMHVLAAAHPTRGDGGFQLIVSHDNGVTKGSITAGFGQDVTALPPPDEDAENALLLANMTQLQANAMEAP